MNRKVLLFLLLIVSLGAVISLLQIFDILDPQRKIYHLIKLLGYLSFLVFMYLHRRERKA